MKVDILEGILRDEKFLEERKEFGFMSTLFDNFLESIYAFLVYVIAVPVVVIPLITKGWGQEWLYAPDDSAITKLLITGLATMVFYYLGVRSDLEGGDTIHMGLGWLCVIIQYIMMFPILAFIKYTWLGTVPYFLAILGLYFINLFLLSYIAHIGFERYKNIATYVELMNIKVAKEYGENMLSLAESDCRQLYEFLATETIEEKQIKKYTNSEFARHNREFTYVLGKLEKIAKKQGCKVKPIKESIVAMSNGHLKGFEGEDLVADYLEDNGFKYMSNLNLYSEELKQSVELDFVILKGDTLFVVESKDYSGEEVSLNSAGDFHVLKRGMKEQKEVVGQVERHRLFLKRILGSDIKMVNLITITSGAMVTDNYNSDYIKLIPYQRLLSMLMELGEPTEELKNKTLGKLKPLMQDEKEFEFFNVEWYINRVEEAFAYDKEALEKVEDLIGLTDIEFLELGVSKTYDRCIENPKSSISKEVYERAVKAKIEKARACVGTGKGNDRLMGFVYLLDGLNAAKKLAESFEGEI